MGVLTVHPTSELPPASLSAPVGRLMRPSLTISSGDSVERAVLELRRNVCGILPVVEDGKLVGVISEAGLTASLGSGLPLTAASSDVMAEALTIVPYASGSDALRQFSENDGRTFVVIDDQRHVMGVISPSDLYPRRRMRPNVGSVGGMATPFGVYLTNGSVRGGASLLAVTSTGAAMFTMLVTCNLLMAPILARINLPFGPNTRDTLEGALVMIPFALLMRFSPLAGVHAAEHMVVHAIERGEELVPEVVARMPRVHPRCGTNLVVAISLFTGIAIPHWTDAPTRVVVAALVTLFLWRPLGSFAQQYITTRKPNLAQIQSGIKAGNDLIEHYSTARDTAVNVPQRIWNSGLLQVMAGSSAVYCVIKLICMAFHVQVAGLI